MQEMMNAINAETTPIVQMWMNWMMLIFLCSLLFVWKHVPARIVLAAFIIGAMVAYVVFQINNNPHLLGISHLLVWVPLAVYLYFNVVRNETFRLASPYGIWIVLLLLTIAISTVFDVRDVALVAMGQK